jgi:hypothetical protein
MSAYNGSAVIIDKDDTQVVVIANLRKYRNGLRTDWGGTLTPTSADGLQRVNNLTEACLRFPDGREARFLRPDTSEWVTSKRLTIIGQLDAPF